MIYLIETTYYNKETKKVLDLLKIGYTEDSRKDIRFMAYKMHNPGFKLLYEIPNLSEDVEKRVQYKFRNLLYSEYGREWFYYSDDIINFFRDIDKIDLESLPKSPMSERRKYWKLNKLVKNVVYWVSIIPKESKRDYIEKIIEDLGSNLKNIQDILNYIEKDYGSESTLEYRKMIERKETKKYCNDDIINQEVSNFLYQYEQLGTYFEKARLLCESDLSKEVIDLVLAQISEEDDVKSHYIAIGPQKFRALGYKATLVRRELGIVTFSKELLINTIFSNFSIGDRISSAEAKERLRFLYSSISYTATPKATDLDAYFITKEAKVNEISEDGTKKRVKGFDIIGVKPEYQGTYNNLKIIINYDNIFILLFSYCNIYRIILYSYSR